MKKGKKKIAYIITMKSGMESFIYKELDILSERKIGFILYTTKFGVKDIYSPKSNWLVEKIFSINTLLRLPKIFYLLLRKIDLLIESILDNGLIEFLIAANYSISMKENNICHIHSHFGDSKFFIGYYCKKILSTSLSVTIHAHSLYVNKNIKLFKKALNFSDKVFSISEKWAKILRTQYNVDQKKLKIQRLFTDSEVFNSKHEKLITILAVGRFTERKGFKYLIDAAKINEKKNYRYIIVGWGEENIYDYAKDLGLEKIITFFPKLNEKQLSVLYKFSDIFCLPSITTKKEGGEGIPVVLMEAMSTGLPVIATTSGASHEIVNNFLIKEKSSKEIAKTIDKLAESHQLRLNEGKSNTNIVAARYSKNNIDYLHGYFNDLINKKY